MVKEVKKLPFIEYVVGPTEVFLTYSPNDPDYINGNLWHLEKISASKAWDITHGSANIVISINDYFTRDITALHDELINKVVHQDDPTACGYHGLAVSGFAGAETNNSIGLSSIGFNTSIDMSKWASIYYINEAIQRGVEILNFSWITSDAITFRDVIYNALKQGIVCVAAVGNDKKNIGGDPPLVKYPAAHNFGADGQVIAVSATKLDGDQEKFVDGWNYSPGTDPINDPTNAFVDISAPGYAVKMLHYYDYNSYQYGWGTSFATPQVSGTIALILSLNIGNSDLKIPQDVYKIITETAEKIGQYPYDSNGWNQYMGYGRINSYQAVLLGAAYANKSQYAGALSLNNTRHLDRAGGKLHLVFHSGGEVFYRRSADNGNSWELTKRITKGTGSNARESLVAAHDNSVHVVFQHKNDDGSYNVMYTYSSDNGSTWNDPVALVSNISVSSNQSKGPQPVITEGYINNSYMLMVVYTSSSGLYYMTKATSSGSWTSPVNLPSQQSSNNLVWFPGLAAFGNKIILTYDYRFNGVYSRIYDGNWSNENSVSAYVSQQVNTINNRYTSIARYGNSSYIAAWSAQIDDQRWRVVFRKGNSDNTWSDWYDVWEPPANVSHLQPVITWYDNNDPAESNAIAIIYYDSDKNVYVRKWAQVSNEWTLTTLDAQSQYPSVTMVKSINNAPLYIWSNGTQTPYLLKLQEQSLNKTSAIVNTVLYKRAGVVYDASTNTKHCVEVGDYLLTTKDGSKYRIGFPEYDKEKDLDLNTENMWQYLESEPFTIPQDGSELSYTQELYSLTISDSSKSTNAIALAVDQFELILEDVNQGKTLAVLSSGVQNKSGSIDVSAYAGRTVIIKPVVKMNFTDSKTLSYGLGNIYRDEKQDEVLVKNLTTSQILPEEAILFANYPNPFNPSTTFRFALPKDGYVRLTIYSVTGQKVRTLIDGQVSKGYHQIVWDGRNESGHPVSGGLYVYELKTGNNRMLKKMLLVK